MGNERNIPLTLCPRPRRKELIHPPPPSLDLLKLIISIILAALWVYRALCDMINIILSNSHLGKRSIAREMVTFVCPMLAFVLAKV